MKNFELTDSDKDRMKWLNSQSGYVLNKNQLIRLVNEHKKGNLYDKALIEYRLTDINFHAEASLLYALDYDEVMKLIEKNYSNVQ